jgi:hypothetical protein
MEGKELPAWSVRLREERTRRLWSQKGMATRLRDAADEQARRSLPPVESIQRYVRSYESGQYLPGELYAELYCRAFGLTREALFGSSGHTGASAFPSEHDATSLTAWIMASNTSDEAIGRIDEARAALAEAHTRLPPGPVLADVYVLHRQVQALLHSGRQRSRQTRELFRVDADLLAHASLLLDDIHYDATARAHGKAAFLCAEEAASSPAFALSAQAKTARWQGVSCGQPARARHFVRSADLARRGFERSSKSSPVRVLLASQEASAAALLGDADRAHKALREAQDSGLHVAADSGLSTWSCPRPRQALYALSVALRFRDADGALQAADAADAGWVAGDPWLYGVWSLVRIGSGTAYVIKGDLDAAAGQLSAVVTLEPPFRISTITGYLADMDSLLRQRRFTASAQAREMREQIRVFAAAAYPAAALEADR